MSEQIPKNGNGKAYVTIALAVISWAAGSLVQYGVMKTSQADMERRVAADEQTIIDLQKQVREETVPRREFESWKSDLRDRLDTIQNTLDRKRSGG